MRRAAAALGFGVTLGLVAALATGTRNSSGTHSLPAGNPVVSGTTISSTVHNATMSDISTELTNSLDRQGRGAMLAPLQCYDGTAAAPGLTFDGDPDTGLYRVGANTLGWSAAGVKMGEASPSGTYLEGDAGVRGNFWVGGNPYGSANKPNLTLMSASDQFKLYWQDGRGAAGNDCGRIVYDGSSESGGTGNEPHPAWVLQACDDTGAFTANGLRLYRGSNPTSTTGFSHTVTNKNIVKAWALIDTNGVAEATVVDGFNIASVSDNATTLTINIADDMANTSYAVIATTTRGGTSEECGASSAGVAACAFSNSADGAAVNPDADDFNVSIQILGAQ